MNFSIEMSWRLGKLLPPKSARHVMKSKGKETVTLTEALFADDTTLYGERGEMKEGKESFKRKHEKFCRTAPRGQRRASAARNLSRRRDPNCTWIGRKQDVQQRTKRGRHALVTIKK